MFDWLFRPIMYKMATHEERQNTTLELLSINAKLLKAIVYEENGNKVVCKFSKITKSDGVITVDFKPIKIGRRKLTHFDIVKNDLIIIRGYLVGLPTGPRNSITPQYNIHVNLETLNGRSIRYA